MREIEWPDTIAIGAVILVIRFNDAPHDLVELVHFVGRKGLSIDTLEAARKTFCKPRTVDSVAIASIGSELDAPSARRDMGSMTQASHQRSIGPIRLQILNVCLGLLAVFGKEIQTKLIRRRRRV